MAGHDLVRAVMVLLPWLSMLLFAPRNVSAEVVQLDRTYSYGEMIDDINELCSLYPGIVSYISAGESMQGRDIPTVIVGNPDAPHSIMIQSSIHAREYIVSQTTMATVEYMARMMSSGHPSDVVSNTCFYVVPMANPDGVIFSQTVSPAWKANAAGVDLNRNFDCNWQHLRPKGAYFPCSENFKGYGPETENEVVALKELAQSREHDCYISYHQQGDVIYYDDDCIEPHVSLWSRIVASAVRSVNGYCMFNLKTTNASGLTSMGGFTDWVQVSLKKPAVTVECGTRWGEDGQDQARSIFTRNKDSWLEVAKLFY